MTLHGPLTALAALTSLCISHHAEAAGRHHLMHRLHFTHLAQAPNFAWGGSSDVVTEAARWIGSGKFTSLPGAWCADAVSFWLQRAGKPPLASRMAGAALSYGPRGSGQPGDLAVFMGRRGAYHVGVVVVSRRSLIFVRT